MDTMKKKNKQKLVNCTQHAGDGIKLYDGQRERHIKSSTLKKMQSRVQTHEGQILSGKKARKYMNKYSKKYLGKDLSNSWKNTKFTGYVKK